MIKYLGRQKFESPFSGFVHYAVLVEIPAEKARQKSKKHFVAYGNFMVVIGRHKSCDEAEVKTNECP